VKIRTSFERSHGIYGLPRVHDDLLDEQESVSRKRVARLMRVNELVAQCVNAYKRTTISDPTLPYSHNLLKLDFSVDERDKRWVSDITFIATEQGWLYLEVVMVLYSRAIVGWAMDKHIDTELVSKALSMALLNRSPKNKLILHSVKGSQYSLHDYQEMIESHGLVCSMSSTGNC